MKYAITRIDGATELHIDSSIELPNGALTLTDDEFDKLSSSSHVLQNGLLVPYVAPAKTLDEIVANFEAAIQSYLDSAAQAKGYDNITTASSYAAAPNPFQSEGASFVTWRGNVWTYCYGELAKVQAGTRPMPTIAEIIAELPARA